VKIIGAIVLVLDSAYVRERLLPELLRKHFGAGVFDVAVIDRSGSGEVLYSTSPALGARSGADARMRLLGPVPPGVAEIARRPAPRDSERRAEGGPTFLSAPDGDGPWELVARHRRGSLDDVVLRLRRRNLAISFGILLLLAAGMAMIIVSTQRAQRLARLQLDFVAGVSHEFRTPVAVICSAGDNLADGIVDPNPRVKQYGGLVRDQGHRLRDMVEQILAFAAGRGERKYELRPVDAAALIDGTLSDCRTLIEQSGAAVKRNIQADLPQVLADERALKQCFQNLVVNGLKYGGDFPLLAVDARVRRGEVQITVADKGIGIEPGDLPHIFDPFYRGRAAIAAQIHGTGLGLSLARDLMEGMGGRIQVSSTPGKGSSFTLLLKVARPDGARA
jgi:signal transduction histidine kinase